MNFQLRILQEELDGAYFDLEPNKVYRVGNKIDFDIYLGQLAQNQNENVFFDFQWQNNSIEILSSSAPLLSKHLETFLEEEINSGVNLETPCLLKFLSIPFAICSASDSDEKWLKILNAVPQESQNEEIKTSDDGSESLSANEENFLNDMSQPQKNIPRNGFQKYIYDSFQHVYDNFISPISSRINKKALLISLGGGTVLALFFILFIQIQKYYNYHIQEQAKQLVPIEKMQAIKQIEVNLPSRFSNLKFLSNKTDFVLVEGIVKDKNDILFLKNAFAKFPKMVDFKLLTSEEAVYKLNQILHQVHADLVTPEFNLKTYRMRLIGLLSSLDVINDIELAVSNQAPEISDLDTSQVFSLQEAGRDFDDILIKNGIDKRLTVKKNFNDKEIEISGYMSVSEINDLKSTIDEFKKRYANLIVVKFDVKDALASLPFKIASVTTGGLPSMMTTDGRKIFVGGEINGMKLDKITATEISFSGKFPLTLKLDDALGAIGK